MSRKRNEGNLIKKRNSCWPIPYQFGKFTASRVLYYVRNERNEYETVQGEVLPPRARRRAKAKTQQEASPPGE